LFLSTKPRKRVEGGGGKALGTLALYRSRDDSWLTV